MALANHSSQSGQDIFVETASSTGRPLEVGDWHAYLPWPAAPDGQSSTVVDNDEARGIYPIVDVTDPPTIDSYMVRSGDPVLTLNGPEYAAGTTVTRTQTYVSLDADSLRERKDSEGIAHRNIVRYSSVQTKQNPNVWVLSDNEFRDTYTSVANYYQFRLKRRTIGTDPGDPGNVVQDPADYWPKTGQFDPAVYLINSNNGNRIQQEANEQEFEQVWREIGEHDIAADKALFAYRDAVGDAYDAYVADPTEANRTALISLDPADGSWGFPPFYEPNGLGAFRTRRGGR